MCGGDGACCGGHGHWGGDGFALGSFEGFSMSELREYEAGGRGDFLNERES